MHLHIIILHIHVNNKEIYSPDIPHWRGWFHGIFNGSILFSPLYPNNVLEQIQLHYPQQYLQSSACIIFPLNSTAYFSFSSYIEPVIRCFTSCML
jgi:hypothetical protein